ncbi:MAG: hypothetical protein KDB10_23600, partial [Acidimicrobiales bacterium]|nr:hypothetical protein [Acidimicrobiales bacterium]
ALAAGAFLVLGGGDDNASPSTSSTTSTTAPGTANTVTDTLAIATAVREDVDALAATTDALWAVNDGEGTVTRVDPTTLESAAIVDVPAGIAALGGSSSSSGDFFDGIAAAGDDVWVDSTEVALRIDPSSNEVVLRGTQNQAPNAQAITATEQAAWTAADGVGFDTVTRFDRATGEGTELQLDDRGMAMSDIAATTSAVWVTDSSGGRLLRIDPAAVSLSETISVGGVPVAVAAADGAVWVADAEGDDLIRVDADTDEVVETIQLPARPVDVAATQRAAWVTLDSGQVVRVDSSSNELVATIDVADPRSVAATDRDVWVASGSSQVVRIDPG